MLGAGYGALQQLQLYTGAMSGHGDQEAADPAGSGSAGQRSSADAAVGHTKPTATAHQSRTAATGSIPTAVCRPANQAIVSTPNSSAVLCCSCHGQVVISTVTVLLLLRWEGFYAPIIISCSAARQVTCSRRARYMRHFAPPPPPVIQAGSPADHQQQAVASDGGGAGGPPLAVAATALPAHAAPPQVQLEAATAAVAAAPADALLFEEESEDALQDAGRPRKRSRASGSGGRAAHTAPALASGSDDGGSMAHMVSGGAWNGAVGGLCNALGASSALSGHMTG